MKVQAIIPARYDSTRLPGKPLFRIQNKPMVQHIFERAFAVLDTVVATDDERIRDAVLGFGGKCMMTSKSHKSGTDRCSEAASPEYDIIVNVQCDLPFILPEYLELFKKFFDNNKKANISTLVHRQNPNEVNAILNNKGIITDFSRHNFKHIGIYGFRYETLMKLVKLPRTWNECHNSLEQLRWLDHGYKIHPITVPEYVKSVDNYEDIQFLSNSW